MAIHKWVIGLVLYAGLVVGLGGCGSSSDATGGASMEQLASASAQQADDKKAQEEAAAQAEAAQQAPAGSAEAERSKAGRAAVGEGGYMTAMVGARRHILNETDRLAWVQAVRHFQAEHGRLPKDHDEFMNKIVIPMDINLGYKEEDEEFLYEPNEGDWGELYVVKKEPAQP